MFDMVGASENSAAAIAPAVMKPVRLSGIAPRGSLN
jgi:hypothetical protein